VLNRYDLWPNHLMAAKRKGVPVVVVNASTPPLGWGGAISLWARKELFRAVSAWSFVDAAAAAGWEPFLSERGKGLVTGDPRVDRALGRVEAALREGKARERLAHWERKGLTLVAGSTWPEDEEVLLDAWMRLDIPRSLLLVPHEPEESHLTKIEKKLDGLGLKHGRYSSLKEPASWDVLVVDERGALAELYGAGNLAFVGGGYHRHIHSIVEPVAHGLPVAFGPRFRRSPEAVALGATDAALALPESGGGAVLAGWLEKMATEKAVRARADEPLRVFLQIHRGAGERVAEFVHSCITEGTHRLS
jgi:3-deoxy-D-manno-octulosonic-acid transferase